MRVKLTDGEQAALWQRKGLTNNPEAFEKYLEVREHSLRRTKDGNYKARQLYEEAVALDPGFAMTYAVLAFTYVPDVVHGLSKDPGESLYKAYEMANKALSLDASLDTSNCALGLSGPESQPGRKTLRSRYRPGKSSAPEPYTPRELPWVVGRQLDVDEPE